MILVDLKVLISNYMAQTRGQKMLILICLDIWF